MKKAFTMLELVFVIVVIGILAAVIIPKTTTNPTAEASIKLISNIRYTQHLALMDDKYNATNPTWYRERWQIEFVSGNKFSIVHHPNGTETFAIDPQNPDSTLSNLELKGVTVALTGGCNKASIISFDHLGRPMIGSLSAATKSYMAAGSPGQLLTTDCTITLTNASDATDFIILSLKPETGYVSGI